MYSLQGLSVTIQRCENRTVVIPGGVQGIRAPPITWHSVDTALNGPHGDGHCFAAG